MKAALLVLALSLSLSPSQATTIAYDGKQLAADSQVTTGTLVSWTQKIIRCGNAFIACAGNCDAIEQFKAWYAAGHDPEKYPKLDDDELQALVVTPEGAFSYNNKPVPVPEPAPFACGSGAKVAIGAMKAGATAAQAVRIAVDTDLYTGGQVSVHDIAELSK